MKRSILVVRHPSSGTVNTFVYDKQIEVNELFYDHKDGCSIGGLPNSTTGCSKIDSILFGDGTENRFKIVETDFCVYSEELERSLFSLPQDIRMLRNTRNASGVLKIEIDKEGDDGNKCKK